MHKKNQFFKKLRDNGYYIALGVCAVAVAVSGFLFLQEEPVQQRNAAESEVPAVAMPNLPEPLEPVNPTLEIPVNAAAPDEVTEPSSAETTPAVPPAATLSTVWPMEGEVVQCFSMDQLSYNPTTRDWRTHAGMDIAAAKGDVVRAAAEGTVLAVYEDDLLGQTVTVQHTGGYVTHYSNLDPAVRVRAGETVAAGQELGAVGTTALVEIGSEPHLHFAVYRDNTPVDPEEFLDSDSELH